MKGEGMRGRTAALAAASVITAGVVTSVATAAGPPPPPKGVGGAKVQQVAAGLHTPTSFAFGAGTLFEGDGGATTSKVPNGGVFAIKGGAATAVPNSPQFVAGLAWKGDALYVSGGTLAGKGVKWQLLKWSGWNGTTFAKRQVIYTAPKKFDGFNGIAFGPDGRLYVGVDLGLTDGNDHGPATTSPFVYDILSIKPNGKGLKVFATGMRQPWQMAFPKGSSSPFVSVLGQDKPNGIKAPDLVVRVHQGDNFGFPSCNWISTSQCSSFTKPFKLFPPHTDIMGMAIIGKRLYMTSFVSTTGKGPGGEVLSMPLSGGPVKPVVKGFVAPTVGLGVHGGSLYVGELTGQVFKVTP
jgi:glucose/arabinose dehydrogenase